MAADLNTQSPLNVTELDTSSIKPVYVMGQSLRPQNLYHIDQQSLGYVTDGGQYSFFESGFEDTYLRGKRYRIHSLFYTIYLGIVGRAAMAGGYISCDILPRNIGVGAQEGVDYGYYGHNLHWVYSSTGRSWEQIWTSLHPSQGSTVNSTSGHQFLDRPPLIQSAHFPAGIYEQHCAPYLLIRSNGAITIPADTLTILHLGGVVEIEDYRFKDNDYPPLP